MKANLKIFLSFLVFGLFVSNSAIAQSNSEATLSSDTGITLSLADPLGETYDIDISERGWTMAEAQFAVTYFEEKSELIDIELDYPGQKFAITLDLDAPVAVNWNVEKWNQHLYQVK